MANKKWEVTHRGRSYTFELKKLRVSYDHRASLRVCCGRLSGMPVTRLSRRTVS
jgi:hypothetical protein